MERPLIFAEATSYDTPFGVAWEARAWIRDLTGGQHFVAHRSGFDTPTAAARAATHGTASQWAIFAAANAYRLSADEEG